MARAIIQNSPLNDRAMNNLARGLLIAALSLFFLYTGQSFLKPLVIAALLSFILAPIINRLRKFGIWKSPAVLLTVGFALLFLGGIGSTIAYQMSDLAVQLPSYKSTIREKIHVIADRPFASSALDRASSKLKELGDELQKSNIKAMPSQPTDKPILVEVLKPEPKGLQSIANLVQPLLSPLATTGLIILFLLFILLQREDLRDRFLRLAGTADLHRSTAALDDAGQRLSGYFLMQTTLNVGFGVVIAFGLALFGIPHAALWGIMSGLLRFVPFIGTAIASFFPIVLGAAIDPGWHTALVTLSLFLVCELTAKQVLEPKLYGPHTGLSPIAVVVSSLFWSLLWGPIGLLLATPLTVCLVVFGRHIDAFNFIEVLLGDEPALEPEERFYQRLLAGDAAEAADMAEQHLQGNSLSGFYELIPMKALKLAHQDVLLGKLPREMQENIFQTMDAVVDSMDDFEDGPRAVADSEVAKKPSHDLPNLAVEDLLPGWTGPSQILCMGENGALDQSVASILAQILRKHGLSAVQVGVPRTRDELTAEQCNTNLVCILRLGQSSTANLRFLIRRLRRFLPAAQYAACIFSLGASTDVDGMRKAAGADFLTGSLFGTAELCLKLASAPSSSATKLLVGAEFQG